MLTLLRPVLTLLNPVEVEVDRLVTLLFVVLRPVLRLPTSARWLVLLDRPCSATRRPCSTDEDSPVLTLLRPVLTLLNPVEVEVDRLVTLLFVVLRPVLRLPTLLFGRAQARAQRRDARAHG